MQITAYCETCDEYVSTNDRCPKCRTPLFRYPSKAFQESATLDQCPVCGGAHLYRQKDFNRNLGIGLLILGVFGAYFTYGISLLVVTVIDFALYRFVGEVACCYQCGSQFRQIPTIKDVDPFNLVLHDYYKNKREKASH